MKQKPKRYRVITGLIFKGFEFTGIEVKYNTGKRIWNCDSVGQSFDSKNCIEIK